MAKEVEKFQDAVKISCTGKCVHWTLKFGETFDLSESEDFKTDQVKAQVLSLDHAAATAIELGRLAKEYLKGE